MRTFIAVEIPKEKREIVWRLIKSEKERGLPIKWVEFENLHITLKFLGEIDEKKKEELSPILSEISKKYKPFNVSLEGLGCFPSPRNPRVLWVGVGEGDKELIRIAKELENSLIRYGFKKEERKFHPHLTIGRIKTFCKVDDILERPIKTDSFLITSLILFKSTLKPEGPIYDELNRFPLMQV